MLLCFSLSHRHADFRVLEELERRADLVTDALSALVASDVIRGSVPLITCNRFELYVDANETVNWVQDPQIVSRWVREVTGFDNPVLAQQSTVLTHEDVAEHLFAVASGLDSVVVGEDEIVGQVRRARDCANDRDSLTAALDRLFQRASKVSKQVKAQTAIASQGRSLVKLALTLAESRIPDWSTSRALLIGTGKYAGATLVQLRRLGVEDINVWSPSGRQIGFAARRGATPVGDESLPQVLASADFVIACTSVQQPVLTFDLVRRARTLHTNSATPQLLIDLGMPRNIDESVDSLHGISRLDLEMIRHHAALDEFSGITDAEVVLADALEHYRADQHDAAIAADLVTVRTATLHSLEHEIERLRARHALTPEIEAALRHLGSVLLHDMLANAHEVARSGNPQAVHNAVSTLFGEGYEPPAAPHQHREPDSLVG